MTKEAFLRNVLQIDDELLIQEALEVSDLVVYSKGSHLWQEGDPITRIPLLISGIVRGYFNTEDGKEITDCIVMQSGYPLMPSSDISVPAPINIQALSKTYVFFIRIPEFLSLTERHPAVRELYKDAMVWSAEMHRNLKIISYEYSAQQRYEWFLENYPGLIDKISHKHIASFLNMTPVTLSRLIHAAEE